MKLNLGCGNRPMEGYINLDRKNGQEVYPLDEYPDGTVDEIRASHVLEHFSHRDIYNVVKNWVDKLGPGGCLKVAVPDFEVVTKAYLEGKPINVQGYTMGGHVDSDDHHGAIFDGEALAELFYELGLERIKLWESDHDDCSALPISLNMMAYKPHKDPEVAISDAVRMSLGAPRFAPVMHFRCTISALTKLNIPYTVMQGCFWHQNICRTMQKDLELGAKYIMTADYDTVFTPSDVLELYRLMEAYPEADAIFSTQSKRMSDHALFSIKDENGEYKKSMYAHDFNRNLTRAYSGHFGLTIIRGEKLAQLPKPWMNDRPNPEGEWGEDRVDSDISFWENWKEAGFKAYLANKVVVGHMEEFITWPDHNFKPIYQTLTDYVCKGKPKGSR